MTPENKQFIYILRLIPPLLDESNWTKKEEEIVDRRFSRLKELLMQGKLVLAGKTAGLDQKTFGLVILEVPSEEEANDIMRTDPSVAEGIMEAELFPYHVALIRK